MRWRWVGIDEAGYGPNLGPLVMTAVVAETIIPIEECSAAWKRPDLWQHLAATVDRAGGCPNRLWIDDSKAIFRAGKGRDRLEAACLAAIMAFGASRPRSLRDLLERTAIHRVEEAELSPWFDARTLDCQSLKALSAELETILALRPLEPADSTWRIRNIHVAVVGPSRFNYGLGQTGSKAEVHFAAFADLMRLIWEAGPANMPTFVTGDKHGGRHYYYERLGLCFPGLWIERGAEGAESSHYVVRDHDRRLHLHLRPRADQADGLVALASIVSKTVRELWMDGFNDYWCERIPGLRRCAGYPLDARRFRDDIEARARTEGHNPDRWWRAK